MNTNSINFNYETDFILDNESHISNWIEDVITEEGYSFTEINYIFCNDEYLLDINIKYLNHNTYTDIITFDYTNNKLISSDIFISVERVKENSITFNTNFQTELLRVIIHGILHLCGFKDKTDSEKQLMRSKEDYYINNYFS